MHFWFLDIRKRHLQIRRKHPNNKNDENSDDMTHKTTLNNLFNQIIWRTVVNLRALFDTIKEQKNFEVWTENVLKIYIFYNEI